MSKILIDRAVMEPCADESDCSHIPWCRNRVDCQRAALEQPEPEPDPVARVIDNGTPEGSTEWIPYSMRQATVKTGDLLYTYPLSREWVGLKEEEIHGMYRRAGLEAYYPRDYVVQYDYERRFDAFARALEAKLKEKNT